MYKKILYPSSPGQKPDSGYTWAMGLAARMNAALCFFTTVPENEKNRAAFVDDLSHSLLEAQGNYLQNTSAGVNPATTERHIWDGDFPFGLAKFIQKTRFDIVVIDSQASELPENTLTYVVRNSNGVIVLPKRDPLTPSTEAGEQHATDSFYRVLHKAEFYKLPENFYFTLGQDRGLFNYLRSLFRKKTADQIPY